MCTCALKNDPLANIREKSLSKWLCWPGFSSLRGDGGEGHQWDWCLPMTISCLPSSEGVLHTHSNRKRFNIWDTFSPLGIWPIYCLLLGVFCVWKDQAGCFPTCAKLQTTRSQQWMQPAGIIDHEESGQGRFRKVFDWKFGIWNN